MVRKTGHFIGSERAKMKNRLLVPLLVLPVAFGFQSYMIQRYHGLLARSLKEEARMGNLNQ